MTNERIAAVDVGLDGALLCLEGDALVGVMPMPTVTLGKSGGKTGRLVAWVAAVRQLRAWEPGLLLIEQQGVRPKQGLASSGLLMRQFGGWEGVAAGLLLSHHLIAPATWAAALNVPRTMLGGKGGSWTVISRRAPKIATEIEHLIKSKEHRIAAADCWCMIEAHRRTVTAERRKPGRKPAVAAVDDEFFA